MIRHKEEHLMMQNEVGCASEGPGNQQRQQNPLITAV